MEDLGTPIEERNDEARSEDVEEAAATMVCFTSETPRVVGGSRRSREKVSAIEPVAKIPQRQLYGSEVDMVGAMKLRARDRDVEGW